MSRKKAESNEKSAPSSVLKDARPRRERLKPSVLEELWSIWRADPRVPSVQSRRLWANSRNADPYLVGSWFLRRRTCAKKAGQPLPTGSYDLLLHLPITPKREPSPTFLEAALDLPSDDTLAFPPDDDDLNNLDASSDTAFDEDTLIESKGTEMLAYKEVPSPKNYHRRSQSSSANLDAVRYHSDEDTPSLENHLLPVCDQGRGTKSGLTCILCSESVQDGSDATSNSKLCLDFLPDTCSEFIQDEILLDVTSDSNEDLPTPYLCLDFLPDTLSELSAIPFLFRTPSAIHLDNTASYRSMDDWAIIEDELGRLVNDGELDFSFLDNPLFASIELVK